VQLPDDMTPDEVSKWANEQLREVACNVDGTDTPFVVQAELKGWNKGYVLAPPSLNAPSGRRYWWLTEPPKSRDDLPLWMPLIAPKARENTKSKSSSKRRKSIKVDEGVIDAFVALLAPHWIKGKRHHLALYLTGFLGKAGWSWNDTERFLCKIAQIADDEELDDDRLRALRDTYAKLSHNPNGVAGLSQLAKEKLLPDWVLTALQGLVTLTNRTDKEEQKTQRDCPFCQLSDAELFERARPVLDAETPLQAAVERVSAIFNLVGENDNLQLLLLALTTRIFPQPVNALVIGGIGQGKSFLTDAACAALPPCRYRRIVGASARALLFHPLVKGTVLQWLELPDLGEDTIAATILRSILWQAPQEATTDYLFVEWTPKGARRRSVQVPRQVALVTTRTNFPKDEQLLSRFLVLEIREASEKRRAVFHAQADAFNGIAHDLDEGALEPLRAFAEWLGRVQARVTIPYAHALADLFAELPPNERDYRDFATLLKLIAACALWNLAKRQHAFDGDRLQVTADLADYATVYRLLLPVWGKPRSAALSETERRVAEALKESDHPATAEELAKVTDIPDRSIRRILKSLADKGIAERGEKRGRSHEWRLAGDLDAFTATLPTPEEVAAVWQPDPDPTPENVSRKMFHGQTVIHGHEGLTAKNPSSIGTFGVTVKRSSETIHTAHSTTLHDHDKASENFSPVADADSLKNRDRDDREAKNPSGTSTFCGQPPLTANDRDDRDDRHDCDLPDPEGDLEVKVVCPRCGAWKRIPPDILMLTDPRCLVCGEVMRPASEDDPPEGVPPPPPSESASPPDLPTQSGQPDTDFGDTER
jgi:DNA-binding transcriptional ArsR family regulator